MGFTFKFICVNKSYVGLPPSRPPVRHTRSECARCRIYCTRDPKYAVAFIHAKINESRLSDMHPIYGGTRGTFPENAALPPLESGLFLWAHVLQIEAEDFDAVIETGSLEIPDAIALVAQPDKAVLGSPEWRALTAKAAANARHDQPGGSRDKQRQMRELWASGKYTSRDLCAEQECAALDMSFSAARKALINTPEPIRC